MLTTGQKRNRDHDMIELAISNCIIVKNRKKSRGNNKNDGCQYRNKKFYLYSHQLHENTGYVFLGVYPYVPLQIHGSRAIWARRPRAASALLGLQFSISARHKTRRCLNFAEIAVLRQRLFIRSVREGLRVRARRRRRGRRR